MAHLRQDQRNALESVFEGKPALKEAIHTAENFTLCEEAGHCDLVFLGTSQGFGTCSRIHGVNVAVFAKLPCEAGRNEEFHPCSHAFLIREAGPEEKDEYQRMHNMSVYVVERLVIGESEGRAVRFMPTGEKKSYVHRCM